MEGQMSQALAEIVACKGCKWCEVRQYAICVHSKSYAQMFDFYSGNVITQPMSTQTMRTIGPCRPEAVLFEPKE